MKQPNKANKHNPKILKMYSRFVCKVVFLKLFFKSNELGKSQEIKNKSLQ